MRKWLAAVGCVLALEAWGADIHAHHHHRMPREVSVSHAAFQVPDVMLVDSRGHSVRIKEVLEGDVPVMMDFIFTSCTVICPMLSASFAGVQAAQKEALARGKLRLVSISIDPEHDTPDELERYAARYHAGPGWMFLTGDAGDIVALQKAFEAYRGNKMNHAPLTFLRSPSRQGWVRVEGFASGSSLLRLLNAWEEGKDL